METATFMSAQEQLALAASQPLPPSGIVGLGPAVAFGQGAINRAVNGDGTIHRTDLVGDMSQILMHTGMSAAELQRALVSSSVPVRENLEAPARVLVPLDTPLRNMLPRSPGAGLSSLWRQITSFGGGYGGSTTQTAGGASGTATITVTNSQGFFVNDTILVDTGANQETRVIASIAGPGAGAVITVSTNFAISHTGAAVVKAGVQPGSGVASQAFFGESGAPAEHTEVYANRSATYTLMGVMGNISGLAIYGGANYQAQLAQTKTNALRNLMLNEENALLNGDSTQVLAPYGDGTNPYAYDGMITAIKTANGTPVDQIQTAVGALTFAHIDGQLRRLYNQGAQQPYIVCNSQEALSISHIALATGTTNQAPLRVTIDQSMTGNGIVGVRVSGYRHPVTGEVVPVIISRFVSPGTMVFGCLYLPDGSPASDVSVLPQVQLPVVAGAQQIQGYVAQDIAPTAAAPQVFKFLVSLASVFRMKSAVHFAKSSGLTAV